MILLAPNHDNNYTIPVYARDVLPVTSFVNLGKGCDGKLFWKGQDGLSLPFSPFTYSGNIIHKVIEKVGADDCFAALWKKEKHKEEERIKEQYGKLARLVLPLEVADPLFYVKMYAVEKYISVKTIGKRGNFKKQRKNEAEKESDVGGWPLSTIGKVDLLIRKKNKLIIIDFKTGKIRENNEIKENYRHQLIIYGYCVVEKGRVGNNGKGKIKLVLYPLGSPEVPEEWEYDHEEAKKLYFKQQESLTSVNKKIKENRLEEIFKPSADECINCNRKISCKFYHQWLQRNEYQNDTLYVDIIGRVESVVPLIDKNSLINFQDGRQLKVYASKVSLGITQGDNIFVGNVLKSRTYHSFFKETNRTFFVILGH